MASPLPVTGEPLVLLLSVNSKVSGLAIGGDGCLRCGDDFTAFLVGFFNFMVVHNLDRYGVVSTGVR